MTALADRPAVLDSATVTDLYVALNAELVGWLAKQAQGGAEDLAQEVWVRVWRGANSYRPEDGTAKTWVYAIARNVVADHYRRTGCRPVAAGFEVDIADDIDVAEAAAEHLDADRDARALNVAIDRLPQAYGDVVRMRYLDEQSVADTAQVLGRPAGTVKSTAHRALRLLAELLNAPTQLDRRPTPPAPALNRSIESVRRSDDAPAPRPAPPSREAEGPLLAVRARRRRTPVPVTQRGDRGHRQRAGRHQLLNSRHRPGVLMFANNPALAWLAFFLFTAAVVFTAWLLTRFTPAELYRFAVAGFWIGFAFLFLGLATLVARRTARSRRAQDFRLRHPRASTVDREFDAITAGFDRPSDSRKET
jgi:RNA polymerase sigma-70 factor (ECF subfamily)